MECCHSTRILRKRRPRPCQFQAVAKSPPLIVDGKVLIKRRAESEASISYFNRAFLGPKIYVPRAPAGARNHNFASHGGCARADKGAYPSVASPAVTRLLVIFAGILKRSYPLVMAMVVRRIC